LFLFSSTFPSQSLPTAFSTGRFGVFSQFQRFFVVTICPWGPNQLFCPIFLPINVPPPTCLGLCHLSYFFSLSLRFFIFFSLVLSIKDFNHPLPPFGFRYLQSFWMLPCVFCFFHVVHGNRLFADSWCRPANFQTTRPTSHFCGRCSPLCRYCFTSVVFVLPFTPRRGICTGLVLVKYTQPQTAVVSSVPFL